MRLIRIFFYILREKHAQVCAEDLSLRCFYTKWSRHRLLGAHCKGQRWIPLCVMVHTTDCIIHHMAKTVRMCDCVCLSVFLLKCLCLSLVRRSEAAERQKPPSLSHTHRSGKKATIRGREEEHQKVRQDPEFLIQLSGSQGYFTPSSPCFPLLCGCNQEGQIKGGGRVSLQRFSSQSSQSVAESGALGGT